MFPLTKCFSCLTIILLCHTANCTVGVEMTHCCFHFKSNPAIPYFTPNICEYLKIIYIYVKSLKHLQDYDFFFFGLVGMKDGSVVFLLRTRLKREKIKLDGWINKSSDFDTAEHTMFAQNTRKLVSFNPNHLLILSQTTILTLTLSK